MQPDLLQQLLKPKFYNQDYSFPDLVRGFDTTIEMTDEDTFTCASRFDFPCCLNFASHKRPGGGYKSVWAQAGPIKSWFKHTT